MCEHWGEQRCQEGMALPLVCFGVMTTAQARVAQAGGLDSGGLCCRKPVRKARNRTDKRPVLALLLIGTGRGASDFVPTTVFTPQW